MKHLWEVDHDYYCSENNYFNGDCFEKWDSFSDFYEYEGSADMDMNLVFRFDWKKYDEDEGDKKEFLQIFIINQRKGIFRSAEITVTEADEPLVLEYLKPRFIKIMKLWEPFDYVTYDELKAKIQAASEGE